MEKLIDRLSNLADSIGVSVVVSILSHPAVSRAVDGKQAICSIVDHDLIRVVEQLAPGQVQDVLAVVRELCDCLTEDQILVCIGHLIADTVGTVHDVDDLTDDH